MNKVTSIEEALKLIDDLYISNDTDLYTLKILLFNRISNDLLLSKIRDDSNITLLEVLIKNISGIVKKSILDYLVSYLNERFEYNEEVFAIFVRNNLINDYSNVSVDSNHLLEKEYSFYNLPDDTHVRELEDLKKELYDLFLSDGVSSKNAIDALFKVFYYDYFTNKDKCLIELKFLINYKKTYPDKLFFINSNYDQLSYKKGDSSILDDDISYYLCINSKDDTYTIAHELGHLLLDLNTDSELFRYSVLFKRVCMSYNNSSDLEENCNNILDMHNREKELLDKKFSTYICNKYGSEENFKNTLINEYYNGIGTNDLLVKYTSRFDYKGNSKLSKILANAITSKESFYKSKKYANYYANTIRKKLKEKYFKAMTNSLINNSFMAYENFIDTLYFGKVYDKLTPKYDVDPYSVTGSYTDNRIEFFYDDYDHYNQDSAIYYNTSLEDNNPIPFKLCMHGSSYFKKSSYNQIHELFADYYSLTKNEDGKYYIELLREKYPYLIYILDLLYNEIHNSIEDMYLDKNKSI